MLVGDVLRKLDMSRARLLLLGKTDRLADAARDVVGRGELVREFGDRPHHVDDVQIWKRPCLDFLIGFWPVTIRIGMPP
jgi:hypothetical protein